MFDAFEGIRPISGWLLLGLVGLLVVVTEIGFRIGVHLRKRQGSRAEFHGNELLSGLMVVLSFFLGFSFQAAYQHFEKRGDLVLQEADAIKTAYMRSAYLPDPQRRNIQKLLRRYVDVQIELADPGNYRRADAAAERIHRALWKQTASLEAHGDMSIGAALFVEALDELKDRQEELSTAANYQRLPGTILLVAVALEALVLLLLGYNIGVAGKRDPLGVIVIVLALAGYLVLIVDLDHPYQRTFDVSERALRDARQVMQYDHH